MTAIEEQHPATPAATSDPNLREFQAHQTAAESTGHSPDSAKPELLSDAVPAAPASASTGEAAHVSSPPAVNSETTTNPFEETNTPALPPRPEPGADTDAMATAAAAAAAAQHPHSVDLYEEPTEHVSPQVEALRSMFPDFDVTVLQSVLESVNNDQERAIDILLGMSDPEYVSTQTTSQPEQPSVDLDEQLARQLMLEDQQQHQRQHATGNSWPRRGEEQVPYQAQPQGSEGRSGTDFTELQRTMGQIAESGKRTFSSIVSRVKAKINEYEQTRNVNSGQPSHASGTTPQWGSAPPTQVDRHTASQAYQQQYYGAGAGAGTGPVSQPSPIAELHQVSSNNASQIQGYNIDEPTVQSQSAPQAPRTTSPIPAPAARSVSPPVASGLSPAASPRPSSDVPRPPPTSSGSPVNAAKIGLLPKRPVSLLNTNSPPARRPTDDDELEYVENPFEEHK
ncbi:hypothetical protein C8Q74DRAFT_1259626 [Fomes fomentarius]|nr:hypothetical protein C8Q74DRAFT_1259626 [Fomes fomentarius]